ncbi:hypothetical protein B0J17DRAFT_187897 [Rhizoctonia solani]|nr:hypothetical protein B0J17DRAFT_187897 [Rhizoctonia solani]
MLPLRVPTRKGLRRSGPLPGLETHSRGRTDLDQGPQPFQRSVLRSRERDTQTVAPHSATHEGISQGYQPPSNNFSSPYPALTPSPRTPHTHPLYSIYEATTDATWPFMQPTAEPYAYPGLFATTQPGYGSLMSQAIATPDYYGQQDNHAVHYVAGPSELHFSQLIGLSTD